MKYTYSTGKTAIEGKTPFSVQSILFIVIIFLLCKIIVFRFKIIKLNRYYLTNNNN